MIIYSYMIFGIKYINNVNYVRSLFLSGKTEIALYNGHEIRYLILNEEKWFVAKDICDALGIQDISTTVRERNKNDRNGTSPENRKLNYVTCYGKFIQQQKLWTINTLGVYQIIDRSKSKNREQLAKWISEFTGIKPIIISEGSYEIG